MFAPVATSSRGPTQYFNDEGVRNFGQKEFGGGGESMKDAGIFLGREKYTGIFFGY